MIRKGAGTAAVLAGLVLAAPAWAADKVGADTTSGAGGARRPASTTRVLPASAPFVAATRPFVAATTPFAATTPGAFVPNPGAVFVPMVPDHRHRHGATTIVIVPTTRVIVVPQIVYYPQTAYAAPSQCVTQGYWSYRWIPYTATQNVWVPGSWAADGSWLDSHWELQAYSSGYYEPLWTPAQAYAC